jgi:hypothetical protein
MYRSIVPVEKLNNWKKFINFITVIHQTAPRKIPELSTYPDDGTSKQDSLHSLLEISVTSHILQFENFVSFPNFLWIGSHQECGYVGILAQVSWIYRRKNAEVISWLKRSACIDRHVRFYRCHPLVVYKREHLFNIHFKVIVNPDYFAERSESFGVSIRLTFKPCKGTSTDAWPCTGITCSWIAQSVQG